MQDVFNDISLEDLAGSETPIINLEDITPVKDNDPAEEKKINKDTVTPTGEETVISNPDALDIDVIASAGDITAIEDLNKEKKGIKDKTSSNTKSSSSSSQNVMFTSLASALVEEGVLSPSKEGEEITDVVGILDAIKIKMKEDRYSDLSENQRSFLEAIENGVPEDEYTQIQQELEQYKTLNDATITSRPDVQQELFRRNFIAQGLDEANATKYAGLAMKADTVAEDAVQAKNALVAARQSHIQQKIDANKVIEAEKIKTEATALAALKSKVNETASIIPGLTINSITKDKIFDSMTAPVAMVGSTPRNEVMEAYATDEEYKLKLHAMHVATKGFTDFSKLTKMTKTQAVSDLEKLLKSKGTTSTPGIATSAQTHITQGATTGSISKHLEFLKL